MRKPGFPPEITTNKRARAYAYWGDSFPWAPAAQISHSYGTPLSKPVAVRSSYSKDHCYWLDSSDFGLGSNVEFPQDNAVPHDTPFARCHSRLPHGDSSLAPHSSSAIARLRPVLPKNTVFTGSICPFPVPICAFLSPKPLLSSLETASSFTNRNDPLCDIPNNLLAHGIKPGMTVAMHLRLISRFWHGTTYLVLMHIVAMLVLAASPALHERLHHHRQSGHHEAESQECAVSLLTDGVCEMGFTPLAAPKPESLADFSLGYSPVERLWAVTLGGESFGRAPPV